MPWRLIITVDTQEMTLLADWLGIQTDRTSQLEPVFDVKSLLCAQMVIPEPVHV